MLLLKLFWTFFKIGCLSFGGGYAMLPVIEHEAAVHGWMDGQQFTELVALAGMTPGPIVVNSAVLLGYSTAGLAGAAASVAGILLPSLLIMLSLAFMLHYLKRWRHSGILMRGLRPAVAGMIAYAALSYAADIGAFAFMDIRFFWAALIVVSAFLALARYNVHPFMVLLTAGFAGAVLFV